MTVKIQKTVKQLELTAEERRSLLYTNIDQLRIPTQVHQSQLRAGGHTLQLQTVKNGAEEVLVVASAQQATTKILQEAPTVQIAQSSGKAELRAVTNEPKIATQENLLQLQLAPAFNYGYPAELVQRALVGAQDGVNTEYRTQEYFLPETIKTFRNGIRQHRGSGWDYTVSESGGPGTGYDTVTFGPEFPPLDWEDLYADYVPAP